MARALLLALALLAQARADDEELLAVEDEDVETGGITHEDVMRAAAAADDHEHPWGFTDLDNQPLALANLVEEHADAKAFALYFFQPSCTHCKAFSPVFDEARSLFAASHGDDAVPFVGINVERSGFEQLEQLYEIVEYPTVILIHDVYSEPFKYEGQAWKSAPDVVSYIEAFADLHECEAWDDDVHEGVRVTLGGGLDANQRALAFVEAQRAARVYASERSIEVACADDSEAFVKVARDFKHEDKTRILEVPAAHNETTQLLPLEAFRERLRRAVVPLVSELTHKSHYGNRMNEVDGMGLITIRPNTTARKLGDTLRAARTIAQELDENRTMRMTFCRLGNDHIPEDEPAKTDAINARYLCEEMAQYTLPRFNTSGGQGFTILDFGPKPETPTLCKHKVDHSTGEDGLTPHMRKILQAKERAKKTKGAQPGQLRRFALHQTFNKKRGRAFLEDYFDDELEEAYLSDKIPEKHLNRGPLFMLVGDTFQQFVNTTDDVFIFIVQRDCLGCHQLWPQVHGMVETIGDQPNMRFGTIDNRINDVFVKPWSDVPSTPALLFLPGGKGEDEAVTIPHKVTVGNDGKERAILDTKQMLSILLDRATHPFKDREELEEEVEAMASVA